MGDRARAVLQHLPLDHRCAIAPRRARARAVRELRGAGQARTAGGWPIGWAAAQFAAGSGPSAQSNHRKRLRDRQRSARRRDGDGKRRHRAAGFGLDILAGQGPEPPGLLVIVRDLDPVQELENVVNYSGRLARLGGLISGVAHQIRNPLNAMNLQLELLNEEAAQGKPVQARVMKVRNEIIRLDEAISALLRFMRPEQLKLGQIELGELLGEVGREVERPGITVRHNLDPVASQLTADRALLGEALRNIAKNAVEAMPEGGEVEFETQLSDDGYVEISIKDHGQGIPAEDLSHIFNLYYTTK